MGPVGVHLTEPATKLAGPFLVLLLWLRLI